MSYKDYVGNIEALRTYLAKDFVEFVRYHLEYEEGLRIGPPQEEIARFLQTPAREKLIIGFRGLSKTYIIKYYAGWRHLRVPTTKIKFISDNLGNAQKMTKAYLHFLKMSPVMNIYAPQSTRLSRTHFDLAHIAPEKDPSVSCVGVDGSITSNRADLILVDDSENLDNSCTPPLAEHLLWKFSEMQAILHPVARFLRDKEGYQMKAEDRTRISAKMPEACQLVAIGTYQHRSSIYLPTDDPAHPLHAAQRIVVPALRREDDNAEALPVEGLEGKYISVWPDRFSTTEILSRRKDKSKFFLDYLCDPKSFLVDNRIIDMDRLQVNDDLAPRFSYAFLDPAQGGKCETACAIGGPLGDSRLYISNILAYNTVPEKWIPLLVRQCKENNVVELHVEAKPEALFSYIQTEVNKVGGMFVRKLVPKGDKAQRITASLEYPINSGKVVFASSVLADSRTKEQLSTLNYDIKKTDLVDRVDALAHLVGHFANRLGMPSNTQSARLS